MKMIKVSRTEAFQAMTKTDFEVYDRQDYLLGNFINENNVAMEKQFYVTDSEVLLLRYYDAQNPSTIYNEVTFNGIGTLTERGLKELKNA